MLGGEIAPYLYRLRAHYPKYFEAVSRTLKSLVPNVERMDIDLDKRRGTLDILVRQDGIDYSSRIVSEGTLRVLALCAIAVNPWGGSLLTFEEPENGVHPRRLELIADLLLSLAVDGNRQVIVTTHSPLFCDAVLRKSRSYPTQIGLFNVRRSGHATVVRSFDISGPLFKNYEIAQALAAGTEDGLFENLLLRGCSMNRSLIVDLFVEDLAHEEFLKPLIRRIAREENVSVTVLPRSARGGHGRAIHEYEIYQMLLEKGLTSEALPDMIVVAIDGDCTTFSKKRNEIIDSTKACFKDRLVTACPDPHVERWYLADPESFQQVVGTLPTVEKGKCNRDYYKNILVQAIRSGAHPVNLGGVEFAQELTEAMNLYRAGQNHHCLKTLVDGLRAKIRQAEQT